MDTGPGFTAEMTGRLVEPAPSGPAAGTLISRFIVVGELGSGGMGLVLLGYDPALDRKVAIKLVRPDVAADALQPRTASLLREAQAMAKIAHKNVVGVLEVGQLEEQVFIVMEHIDGETLRAWLETPRGWREIAAAFAQAGRGLEAAHAMGLVHRDFKPDNVLVARDGRVLVTDFGVAAAAGSADHLVVGTPAYMPPEQRAGHVASPRADQYAFCVALDAALRRARPPRSLRGLIARGLSVDPEERHASMAVLAAALEDAPRRRGRWLAGAGVALAVAAAAAIALRGEPRPSCRGFEPRLAGVWDPARREALRQAFLATGVPSAGAVFERAAGILDERAGAWLAMRTDACRATVERGEQSAALLDLRMACLDRRLGATAGLVDVLERADAEALRRAVPALLALEPLDGCADAEVLRAAVPPPRDPATRAWVKALHGRLDRVEALRAAGRPQQAAALAYVLEVEAEATHHAPIVARALALAAVARDDRMEDGTPEATAKAALAAARVHDDDSLVRSLGSLLRYHVRKSRQVEAVALVPAVLAAAERSGNDRLRAHARESASYAFNASGRFADSVPLLRAAIELRERSDGVDSMSLTLPLSQLATAESELEHYAEARALLSRGLAIVTRRAGADSVAAASLWNSLGRIAVLLDDGAAAEEAFGRLLTIAEGGYGPDSPRLVGPLINRGIALGSLARHEEAIAACDRGLAIEIAANQKRTASQAALRLVRGESLEGLGRIDEALAEIALAIEIYDAVAPENRELPMALDTYGAVLARAGRPADALAPLARAAAIEERTLPAGHDDLLRTYAHQGKALAQLGRRAEARPLVERALAVEVGKQPRVQALHAELSFALALAVGRGDLPRARSLALEARAHFADKGPPSVVAEIDRWLADPR